MHRSGAVSPSQRIQYCERTKIPTDLPTEVLVQREVDVVTPTRHSETPVRLLHWWRHSGKNGHPRSDMPIARLLFERVGVRKYLQEDDLHLSDSQSTSIDQVDPEDTDRERS